jgi:pyridoxine 5-phosphate synthase
MQVSLFIDPDPRQIEKARLLGAAAVEIQTARYSEARTAADRDREIASLQEAAVFVRQQALHLHLGHGLTYTNLPPICQLPGVEELNIGHSIVSRAVLVGMDRAVREMKEAIHLAEAAPRSTSEFR